MAKIVALGDVCTAQSSNIAQKDLTENCGEYPIYGASGFIKNVDFYKQDKPYLAIVKDGAGVGRVLLLPKYSSIIGTMQYILPNDNVDIHFLYYVLVNLNLAKYFSGATIPHIYFKDYKREHFPLPPLSEQHKIASVLDKVSDLISKRRKQLDKLDDLVKARFVEMFGDPVLNPMGWEKKLLSDEAEIKIGPFGSLLHKEDYISGGHALVNPSHIINGKIVTDDKLTISDDKYSELNAYQLVRGDVVVGRRGEMGRCAIVDTDGLLCGTGSLIIRSKGDLSADYIQKVISFPSFKQMIEDVAVGQTMLNLNIPIVSSLLIIKPPKSVQYKYYDFVHQTDNLKSTLTQSLSKLELLKRSLMQEYFG